jgi:uncharacterized protein
MENPEREFMIELVKAQMPFGKYKGKPVCELPEFYLNWFKRKGFPKGKLGAQLETMYEIRLNGLNHLLDPLKKSNR